MLGLIPAGEATVLKEGYEAMGHDVIIVGGGSAGLGAARQAVTLGAKPVLVSDGPIGGDCTWTGCVPSKALIARSRAGFTFPDAIADVHRAIQEIADHESADVLRSEGIDVVEGRGEIVGKGRVSVGDVQLSADSVVLATGSRAAMPPIPGLDEVAGVLTNETLFDLVVMPPRLGIIGGGAIGCEMAMAFAGFGSEVSIFEGSDRLLPNEEPEASAVIERTMAELGVAVTTGSFVDSVSRTSAGIEVQVGGNTTAVDALLVAAGRVPNTGGLGLDRFDVAMEKSGHVKVDEKLRTDAEWLSAAGDVTGLLPFTHSADEQARLAVSHALGKGTRWKYDPSTTPWTTFTRPEVARVGVLEREAPTGSKVVEFPLSLVDRAITDGRTDGFVKLISAPRRLTRGVAGGKLVGATIVADRAGEMIHAPTMAVRLGMFVGRLAQVTVPYPTYATAVQQAAGAFFQPVAGVTARPARR